MRIIFVAPPPQSNSTPSDPDLPEQAVRELSDLHPEHDWTIIKDFHIPGRFSFLKKRQNLRELKALKPDLLVFSSPLNYQSVDQVPTILLFCQPPSMLHKQIRSTLPAIKTVITDTNWLKNELQTATGGMQTQVELLRWIEKAPENGFEHEQLIREKYTSGKQYFFYGGAVGSDGNWEIILRAFSQFKKWQQSGLQMVLAGPVDPSYKDIFNEKLEAYKYHTEVVSLGQAGEDETKQLARSAFASLMPDPTFAGRLHMVRCFRSGIPVIAVKEPVTESFAGDAVMYADREDPGSLSQQMILLYKNEELTNQLVQRARDLVAGEHWQQTLEHFYRIILHTAEQ